MKKAAALLCLSYAPFAQTRIVTPAWVAGDGNPHPVSATGEVVRFLTVHSLPTNSTTNCSTTSVSACPVTGGDSTTAIGSKGIPLLPGQSYTYPVQPPGQPGYSLTQIYYAAAVGDKLDFAWGK
jgi:hypothetical protein